MSIGGTFQYPPGGAITPSQVYQPILRVVRLVHSRVPLSEFLLAKNESQMQPLEDQTGQFWWPHGPLAALKSQSTLSLT
jgi:hypothetical protein